MDARNKQVTVTGVVTNDQGVGRLETTTLTLTDDDPPEVDGETILNYTERGTQPVATYTATNPATVRLVWAVSGPDAAHFSIQNGILRFAAAPDFERPRDIGEDNRYQVTVEATDTTSLPGESLTGRLDITVTVEDAPGMIRLSSTSPRIGTSFTATLRDPDGVGEVTQWCWERSLYRDFPPDPSTLQIACAATTTATYTPVTADRDHYLRVTATYTDSDGTLNKEALAVSDELVSDPGPGPGPGPGPVLVLVPVLVPVLARRMAANPLTRSRSACWRTRARTRVRVALACCQAGCARPTWSSWRSTASSG